MKKLFNFFKRPPVWFVFVWLAITLCAITAALLCMFLLDSVINYVVYALSALSLGYLVYAIIITAPKIKRGIVSKLNRRNFTNKLISHYSFRTAVFAVCSFTLSAAYVAFNGALGIINRSVWYGSLAAYYLLLAVMRGVVIAFYRGKNKLVLKGKDYKAEAFKIYRLCGIGLIVLPTALSAAIAHMVLGKSSFMYYGYTIYVAALYAFYKIIMAIYNAAKAKKSDEAAVGALRNINLADALVSILALQTAMFKQFGGEISFQGQMNAATGTIVCVLTLALGIIMIVWSNKKLKENRDGREF